MLIEIGYGRTPQGSGGRAPAPVRLALTTHAVRASEMDVPTDAARTAWFRSKQ